MSSSRSIAAARNRRSAETTVNVGQSQQRPVTSISSQSAFTQQNQASRQSNQGNKSQGNKPKQQDISDKPTNGLPFSKLSISDAIGLVTLRLGRVEQFMIDIHEQGGVSNANVPDNKLVIDNSVITNIVSRLDSLEKKEHSTTYNEKLIHLENEIVALKNVIVKLTSDTNSFINLTNEKFIDFDEAFLELEKTILPAEEQVVFTDQTTNTTEDATDDDPLETPNINFEIQEDCESAHITDPELQ